MASLTREARAQRLAEEAPRPLPGGRSRGRSGSVGAEAPLPRPRHAPSLPTGLCRGVAVAPSGSREPHLDDQGAGGSCRGCTDLQAGDPCPLTPPGGGPLTALHHGRGLASHACPVTGTQHTDKPPSQTNASGLFCHQTLLECHPPGRPCDPGDSRLPWTSEGPSSYIIISLKKIT